MNFTSIPPKEDLWQYISRTDKKIVMYGMGNGADKILAVCEKYGIEVCDFFASDGFVRGHSFHGKRVLSFSDTVEKYGADNIVVLLSFASSLPDVLDNFKRIASVCELYAPDVPVCGDELFCMDFVKNNCEYIREAYRLLADDESRRIYENVIYYKLTGNIQFLFDAESSKNEVYRTLLTAENITRYADLGAYNGDTVRELYQYAPQLSHVTAFEPDRRSFRKLSEYCETVTEFNINKVNAAAWDCEATLVFGDEGNRNSGIFAKGRSVKVVARSLDGVLNGDAVDYIKYDVEGCEKEAIAGSQSTILTHRPRLLVSVYHRSEDIFALPLQIHALRPNYKLYLRRYPYVPAWDLNLICI